MSESRRRPFLWACSRDMFSKEQQHLIDRYGHFMEALERGKRAPTTEAQVHFVETMKRKVQPESDYELAWTKYRDWCEQQERADRKRKQEHTATRRRERRPSETHWKPDSDKSFVFRCPRSLLSDSEVSFLEQRGERIKRLVQGLDEPVSKWEYTMLENLESGNLNCQASRIWSKYVGRVKHAKANKPDQPESKPKYRNSGDDREAWKRMRHGGYGDFQKRQWDM